MHFFKFAAISLLAGLASASPHPQGGAALCTGLPYGYAGGCGFSNSTSSSLSTTSSTSTTTASSTSTSTTGGPITTPTTPITVVSVNSGSPIDYLRMNAAGLRFYLGGDTLSYCPSQVDQIGACPAGNETVFSLCNMAVVVPGGQQVFVTPHGELGYTQAHSSFRPVGSILCPFVYMKRQDAPFGMLSTQAFGATGFMACPAEGNTWQVFANLRNATVPGGDVTQCLGFGAIAIDSAQNYAAWQYT
ncbi:hypothetical protein LTR67_002539 [Exophiala xenobiotica]